MTPVLSVRRSKLEIDARLEIAALTTVTLLAMVLRFYKLGEWSFWFDEIFTVNRVLAHFSNPAAMFGCGFPGSIWVQLSLVLTCQAFNLFGVSELSARLGPALIGIASVPILYFPTRRWFGVGVGLLSALLLAVSPWHLYWSQNARFYTAIMLFSMLGLFSFFYAIERDRPLFILLGYIFLYLAVSERLTALLAVPVLFAYVLLSRAPTFAKPSGTERRNLLLLIIPSIAFVVFELSLVIATGSSFLLDAFQVFGSDRGPDPIRLVYRIVLNTGVPLTSLATFGGLYLLLRKTRIGLFLAMFAMVPIMLLLLANPFMFTDDRYAFIVLPSWIILGAVAVKEIFARVTVSDYGMLFALAVPLILLADAAFADMLYFQVNNGNRLDWRAAFELVDTRLEDGDVVASYWSELGGYYLGQETRSMREMKPVDVVESGKRYWFVIDDYAIWSAQRISGWIEQRCELIDSQQLHLEKKQTLRVYLCEPSRIA